MKFKTRRFTDTESFARALAGFQQKGTVMQRHSTNSSGGHSAQARRHQPTFNLSKMRHCMALVLCIWFSSSAFAQISAYMIISGPNNICGDDANTNLAIIIDGIPGPYVLTYTDGTSNYAVNNYFSGTPINVAPSSNTNYTLVSLNDIPVTSNNGAVSVTVQQPIAYYLDADGDGYGNPGSVTYACIAPAGYVANNRDCDDSNTSFARVNTVTATITGNTSFCAGANTLLNANATSGVEITAIAAGDFHSLFLKNDGTVWATGSNISGSIFDGGQLGDGTEVNKSIPVQVLGLSGITAIAGGDIHSLFLKNDGTVWATGDNYYGQLGDGTFVSKTTPVPVHGLSGITAIECGYGYSLFLRDDGTVWASGLNNKGQYGNGPVLSNTPVQVNGLSDITALSAGKYHSLFLKNDGTVWATGENSDGQLGDGTNVLKTTPVQVLGLSDITALEALQGQSMFLKNDGSVWVTGVNSFGRFGSILNTRTSVLLSGLSDITAIAGGNGHCLFLKNDGTVLAMGYNQYGALGDGTTESKFTPVPVLGLNGITAIAGGFYHSLFLKNDGTMWATGFNFRGQLGDGTTVQRNTPVPVSGFDVTITSNQWKLNGSDIAGATDATYTATEAGSYTVVVTNSNGCSVTSESITVTVNQPTSFTEIISACGSYTWHDSTYTASNNTATWIGTNAAGCDSTVTLNLTITNSPTATITGNTSFCAGANTLLNANATSGGEITDIAAGSLHSLILKNDGTVWATGWNNYGTLGDGTTEQRTSPVQVLGLSGITAIAGGFFHSLFLKNDGTVWATGYNVAGQLGDGTTEQRTTPVQVLGLSGITAIAAGSSHSLFLKNDSTVWAAGLNNIGQYGGGTTEVRTTPSPVSGLSGITAIASDEYHSLFLKKDGTVLAAGYNPDGQLGDGTYINKNTPVPVLGLSGITAIEAGISHSLFLKNDSTVWATGQNIYGQFGDGTTESTNTPVQVSGLSGISAVTAGAEHSLFLKNDGTVLVTGHNTFGELGDGTTEQRNTPVPLLGLSGITAKADASSHTLFLKNDGTVLSTGYNFIGALGDGTTVNKSTPAPVIGFDVTITSYQWKLNGSDIAGATNATYTATTAGSYTVVATTNYGCSATSESVAVTVKQPTSFTETISACGSYTWHDSTYTASNNTATWIGTNAAGCDSTVTLNLTITNSPTATITGNTSFCAGANTLLNANATSGGEATAIIAGGGFPFSLFLKNDGTVWSTGDNTLGQLGDGTTEQRNTPVQVPGLSNITAIAGGFTHSLFLKNDGTVWAAGSNYVGELGDGTTERRTTPVQVLGLSGITAMAAGSYYSLFLKNDGTVWATGSNFYGQFGDGTTYITSTPVQVSGLNGITAISAGLYHSLFLKNDGTVLAAGFNDKGQLGDGTIVNNSTPVQVLGLSGITAIAGGSFYSLFLKSDSTVWATGGNDYGQLGDGTRDSTSTPVQVSGLNGITAIAAGSGHSLFLKNNGTVLATGINNSGQYGDGTNDSRTTPAQVLNLSGISAIAGASYHSLFLKNDGTVLATGWNLAGQLGDGTNEQRNVPVPVSGFDVTITSYQWKLNGSDIAGATDAAYTATEAGSYTVVVTNSNGCSVTSESITVTVNEPSTAIETIIACVSYTWHDSTYTASNNTATWTGTNAAGCDSTVTLNLTIQNLSTAPTSITSSVVFALAGTNFTLSVNGGSLGTDATWNWYTASCGGTLIGTGASISVAQNVNTTYFVRAEGTCNTTACATLTVNIGCVPQSVSASSTIVCLGSSTTLNVQGNLTAGASWKWYSASCGSTLVGTGASISIAPTTTTTYYVRSEGGACGTTTCLSIAIQVRTIPSTPQGIIVPNRVCRNAMNTFSVQNPIAGLTYTWIIPSGWSIASGQGTATLTVMVGQNNGQVSVKASNSCGSSALFKRAVGPINCRRSEEAEADAGMESARTEETVETVMTATDALNAIAVYPNPTTGEARITFSATTAGQYAISIVDLQGRVITSTSGAAIEGNNTLDINLSNRSNGVYMIHLMHNDTLKTLRVVKM